MFKWYVILGAALVPMVLGFIYYHPKVMGATWMKVAGMTDEKIKAGNMGVTFGVSFIMSLLLAVVMHPSTIHQFHISSLLMTEPGFADQTGEAYNQMLALMEQYGTKGRTFGHGAVHGFGYGLMMALPVLATNSLFEQKGGKYIMVNGLYWIICITLMGGIVGGWG